MRSTACQVLGCHVDVSCEQKPYCLKRKCCLYHLKADAVQLKGKEGVWRWCFQCGKMQRLSEFDATHRNCRVSLMKRHIASHKPRRTGSDNRQTLAVRSGTALTAGIKVEQPLELEDHMCLQQAAPVGEGTPSSSSCQQHEPLHGLPGSGSCLSGMKAPAAGSSVLPPQQQQQLCAAPSLGGPFFPDAVAVAEAAAGGGEQALMLVDALIDEMGLLPAFELPQASISSPGAGQLQEQQQAAEADPTAAALEEMIEQEMLAAAQSVSGSGSGDFGAALSAHHAACDALSSSSSNGMAGPAAATANMQLQWEAAQRAFQCGATTNNGSIASESQLHELLQQQLREEEQLQAAMLGSQQSFQLNNAPGMGLDCSGVNPAPDALAMAAGVVTPQPFAAPCGGESVAAANGLRQARLLLLQQQYFELQAAIEGMKQQVASIQSCLPCAVGFPW